jgi:heme O synthase-like polyprenyltransferase
LAFLAPAVQAVVGRVPPARWARSLFLISLAYLPALFGAVVIDRLLAAWLR